MKREDQTCDACGSVVTGKQLSNGHLEYKEAIVVLKNIVYRRLLCIHCEIKLCDALFGKSKSYV